MENKLPERKSTRLKNYNYSKTGVYFVTICTEDKKQILSNVVGEGLAPPENENIKQIEWLQKDPTNFTDKYKIILTPVGRVVEDQILNLEKRYDNVKIKSYVIMPDHIHLLIFLRMEAGGASPSPTLYDVVCAFKSLTSRECKNKFGIEKMFQRSFFDHVIRDREDYEVRLKYIYENPIKWYYRESNK